MSSNNHHDIRVTVLLTSEDFLNMKTMADDDGLSDSSFIRQLIKQAARRKAMDKLSEEKRLRDSEEPAQLVSRSGV